eukprot:5133935-Lingulodinium_polyedra.AAC.1
MSSRRMDKTAACPAAVKQVGRREALPGDIVEDFAVDGTGHNDHPVGQHSSALAGRIRYSQMPGSRPRANGSVRRENDEPGDGPRNSNNARFATHRCPARNRRLL